MSIDWQAVAADFTRDGALRDIYIYQTDAADWERAFSTIRSLATNIQYRCGDHVLPLPASFGDPHEFGRQLTFRVGNICFQCRFFQDLEIEFDFWPYLLTGQADLDDLLAFIQQLGYSIGKPVVVCPENCPESPILRYDPESCSVVFIPCARTGRA
jgi:hypothetical protein